MTIALGAIYRIVGKFGWEDAWQIKFYSFQALGGKSLVNE